MPVSQEGQPGVPAGQDRLRRALLTGPESPLGGVAAEIILSVPAISIAGGTDEIQRTVIAERIRRLPRDREQENRAVP